MPTAMRSIQVPRLEMSAPVQSVVKPRFEKARTRGRDAGRPLMDGRSLRLAARERERGGETPSVSGGGPGGTRRRSAPKVREQLEPRQDPEPLDSDRLSKPRSAV